MKNFIRDKLLTIITGVVLVGAFALAIWLLLFHLPSQRPVRTYYSYAFTQVGEDWQHFALVRHYMINRRMQHRLYLICGEIMVVPTATTIFHNGNLSELKGGDEC